MTEVKKRCYDHHACPYHALMESKIQMALPRWVFLAATSLLVTALIAFGSWHIASLKEFDKKYYQTLDRLHDQLHETNRVVSRIEAKQNIVLRRLDLNGFRDKE